MTLPPLSTPSPYDTTASEQRDALHSLCTALEVVATLREMRRLLLESVMMRHGVDSESDRGDEEEESREEDDDDEEASLYSGADYVDAAYGELEPEYGELATWNDADDSPARS